MKTAKLSRASGSKARSRSWYIKNKRRVLDQRRQRYAQDEAYRKEQRRRSLLRYWERRKLSKKRSWREIKSSVWLKVPNGWSAGYTVADVAKMFCRSPRTLQWWIRKGVIPPPTPYLGKLGEVVKAYLPEEIVVFRTHAKLLRYPKRRMTQSVFSLYVNRDVQALRTKKG